MQYPADNNIQVPNGWTRYDFSINFCHENSRLLISCNPSNRRPKNYNSSFPNQQKLCSCISCQLIISRQIIKPYDRNNYLLTPCQGLKNEKPKKVILSNVLPTITNKTHKNNFTSQIKLTLVSKISMLHINPTGETYGHMVSYRRQTCQQDLNEKNIPPSFLLIDNFGSTHQIFLPFDDISCFKCHSKAHKADDCNIDSDYYQLLFSQSHMD